MSEDSMSSPKAINALEFAAWAFGEINSNLKRAMLAEFVVGKALGCLSRFHEEWNAFDLKYAGRRVEVKSSGFGTPPFYVTKHPTRPKFDIAKRSWAWSNELQDFLGQGVPTRHSDIYVFAATQGTNARDFRPFETEGWVFFVAATDRLNEQFGNQKTVTASTLEARFGRVDFAHLKNAVDRAIGEKSK